MNEEKKRLNKTFEVFDVTFEKNGLKLIGKGIDLTSIPKIFIEIMVTDRTKIKNDYNLIANMYDADNCIEFYEEEYIEADSLDDIYTIEIEFSSVKPEQLKDVEKIRIYLSKCD